MSAAVAAEPDLDQPYAAPSGGDHHRGGRRRRRALLLASDDGTVLSDGGIAPARRPRRTTAALRSRSRCRARRAGPSGAGSRRRRRRRARSSVRRGDAATADLDALLAASGDERATLVVAPLANRRRELLGVLALVCPERAGVERELVDFVGALTGAASVSLETKQLLKAQKDLFEALIQLIASAIDAKSPYTGGPLRAGARAHQDAGAGGVRRDRGPVQGVRSLRRGVGGGAHRCVCCTTAARSPRRNTWSTSATKLETIYDRIHEVRMRFEVLKRDAEICVPAQDRGRRRRRRPRARRSRRNCAPSTGVRIRRRVQRGRRVSWRRSASRG